MGLIFVKKVLSKLYYYGHKLYNVSARILTQWYAYCHAASRHAVLLPYKSIQFQKNADDEFSQNEFKSFYRTVAEIEWLLLLLVILYLLSPGAIIINEFSIFTCLISFAIFISFANLAAFRGLYNPWVLAIKTWVMIIFITWLVWNTGKISSPLTHLYMLAVITSALTLGRTTTLLQVILIAACYTYLVYSVSIPIFSINYVSVLLTRLAPALLVAYLTTSLAADSQRARQRIKHLSETDSLTGCFNRRAFAQFISQEYQRSVRYKQPFSLLMIDTDNLKQVNDTYGHNAGDELIKFFAKIIQHCLRSNDIVARYGGDEFLILLVETNLSAANKVAKRINRLIRSTPLKLTNQKISTTASIGIANFPQHGNFIDELINRADLAMYHSKLNGKNQVSIFTD